jgi:hypothetical protein
LDDAPDRWPLLCAIRISRVVSEWTRCDCYLIPGKYAGEFNHNINVKRSDEERPRGNDTKAPPDNTRLGRALRRKRLGIEDDDALPEGTLSSHPPLDRALKQYYAERDAELAAEAAVETCTDDPVLDRPEGVPPLENSGSNG